MPCFCTDLISLMSFMFKFYYYCYFFLFCLQYNEVLGKGASKTVYVVAIFLHSNPNLLYVHVLIRLVLWHFWVFQLPSFRWIWRNWSSLEPGETVRFSAKTRGSGEIILWNSSSQDSETQEYYEILLFLGWYCQQEHQFCDRNVHFRYSQTVSTNCFLLIF